MIYDEFAQALLQRIAAGEDLEVRYALITSTPDHDSRREAINRANGVITRHLQPFDGAPCNCGWPENGLPYAPSHRAHVAERLWDAECLREES